jgi:4,5:9,10-diseco-3-hydroxy-5,9,17-trioxoandrosta-1(10),2-diene-4-oate hydrolase
MEMRGIRSMLRCIYGPEGITAAGMRKVFEKQLYDSALVTDALVEDRTAVALTQPIEVFRTMKVDNQADRLGELQCPVLGLWGVDDLFCPVSGAATLAARVRDCRVVTLSRCGHWVMVEHADVFNRLVVDFLDHG